MDGFITQSFFSFSSFYFYIPLSRPGFALFPSERVSKRISCGSALSCYGAGQQEIEVGCVLGCTVNKEDEVYRFSLRFLFPLRFYVFLMLSLVGAVGLTRRLAGERMATLVKYRQPTSKQLVGL